MDWRGLVAGRWRQRGDHGYLPGLPDCDWILAPAGAEGRDGIAKGRAVGGGKDELEGGRWKRRREHLDLKYGGMMCWMSDRLIHGKSMRASMDEMLCNEMFLVICEQLQFDWLIDG